MHVFSPEIIAVLLASGALAGFCAGLLGIGGGIILVPLFLWCFPLAGFPPQTLVHTALGTSLGIIIPTACSSALAHRKHGNVNWHHVSIMALGAVTGALLGSTLAVLLSGARLKGLFGLMLMLVGVEMFLSSRRRLPPVTEKEVPIYKLLLVGLAGGSFSSFFGIGGGVVTVPLMVLYLCLPIHLAVGNASALIVIASSVGTLSYILHGWGQAGLAPFSLGFVNPLVVALVIPASISLARIGVRVARRVPHDKLAKIFAVLQFFIGARLLWQMFLH